MLCVGFHLSRETTEFIVPLGNVRSWPCSFCYGCTSPHASDSLCYTSGTGRQNWSWAGLFFPSFWCASHQRAVAGFSLQLPARRPAHVSSWTCPWLVPPSCLCQWQGLSCLPCRHPYIGGGAGPQSSFLWPVPSKGCLWVFGHPPS